MLTAEKFTISLPRAFRIAHGSSQTRDTILVRLEDGPWIGHGEGALPPYYPSEAEACLAWLRSDTSLPAPAEAAAAVAALDIAKHDLEGQKSGKPLWQLWGLDPARIPSCPRTISIPLDENDLREQLAEGHGHFKLKTGSGDLAWDEHCAHLLREEFPEAQFSVDANGSWLPEEAARLIPLFGKLGVEFVEQPVGRSWGAWRELRGRLTGQSVPPLVADESLQGEEDLASARGFAEGVNIKLLKSGGLTGARRWIDLARQAGLRVMIGVMVETGIGRSAAAQLAPLADWLDIDPPDSIPPEPLIGFRMEGNRLILSERPGLGLIRP